MNQKLKRHLKKHQVTYSCIATAAVTTIGVVGVTCLVMRKNTGQGEVSNTSSFTFGNKQVINMTTKKTITKYGNDVGRPGNLVVELDESGNMIDQPDFRSQTLVARDVGVSNNDMWRHLNGKHSHVNGRRFVRLKDYIEQLRIMAEAINESKAA